MHNGVVRNPRGERVVLAAVLVGRVAALLLLVRAAALLRTPLARGLARDLDRVAGDLPAARLLGEARQLVRRLVDRLQVPFMLELLARRRDVGMPLLREPAPGELDLALVERRLDLQEEDGLLDVDDLWHVVLR